MLNQNQYHRGATRLYLYPDRVQVWYLYQFKPSMGEAPTYVLTDYVLGVWKELNKEGGVYEWGV
jgi:hypothetical protein